MLAQDAHHGVVVLGVDPLAGLMLLHQAAHQLIGGVGGRHTALGGLNQLQPVALIPQHQLLLLGEDCSLLRGADGRRGREGGSPGAEAEQQQQWPGGLAHGHQCENTMQAPWRAESGKVFPGKG